MISKLLDELHWDEIEEHLKVCSSDGENTQIYFTHTKSFINLMAEEYKENFKDLPSYKIDEVAVKVRGNLSSVKESIIELIVTSASEYNFDNKTWTIWDQENDINVIFSFYKYLLSQNEYKGGDVKEIQKANANWKVLVKKELEGRVGYNND